MKITAQFGLSCVALLLVAGSVALVGKSTPNVEAAYQLRVRLGAELQSETQTALQAILEVLEHADSGSIEPRAQGPNSSDHLRFTTPDGEFEIRTESGPAWEGVQVVLEGPDGTQVLSTQVAVHHPFDAPNGLDDNGNGVIDETGLSFHVRENSIRVSLTTESHTHGVPMTHSMQSSVSLP